MQEKEKERLLQEKENERQFQLKLKELEMHDKTKQVPLPLDPTELYHVTKHIWLVPSFQEKKMTNNFYILKKWLKIWNGQKKHWTSLLQSVVIGKAREIYTQLNIEQSSNHDTLKELILRHANLYLKSTDKSLESVEKKMIKITLNLLEAKSNYFTVVLIKKDRSRLCKT